METPPLPPGPDDQLPTRKAQPYAVDKLNVVHHYLWNFSVACNGASRGYQAARWWYIDAMAGPGVNRLDDGTRFAGSPLLAQMVGGSIQTPPADGLVFAEPAPHLSAALRERVGKDDRVRIITDDVNHAVDRILELVPRYRPSLAFFDPEGFDAHWSTLRRFAHHRQGGRKMELLVMLPTHVGMLRTLTVNRDPDDWVPEKWDQVFGPLNWRAIYEARRRNDLTASQAPRDMVDLYRDGFRHDLDYRVVFRRRVPAEGPTAYWLVFATDDVGGEKIMDAVMNKIYIPGPIPAQMSLWDEPPPDPKNWR